jgi:chaperonin cofactor prefoldin
MFKGFSLRDKRKSTPTSSHVGVGNVIEFGDGGRLRSEISDECNLNFIGSDPPEVTLCKTVNFAAAGRMKSALRTIIHDIDELEANQDARTSRPGSTELKQKILASLSLTSKQPQDYGVVSLLGDSKNDDDEEDDDDPNWILSPQQVFDLTVSTLRAQIETMEERNGFISHIQALEKQLDGRHQDDCSGRNQQLNHQKNDVQVAKLSQQVKSLTHELHKSQEAIVKLQQERDSHQKAVTELSRILRSCDPSDDKNSSDVTNANEAMTPERALYLTIYRLKKQIEAMEDERHEFLAEIHNLVATLSELKSEKEARELKIDVLENQLAAIEKQFEVMDAALNEGPLTCHMASAAGILFE